ncbi:MAG: hypothetical protein JWQ98_2234 [Chlorobi bacterium]|nr:hypothetical protein [Chlorobiota bacterium]
MKLANILPLPSRRFSSGSANIFRAYRTPLLLIFFLLIPALAICQKTSSRLTPVIEQFRSKEREVRDSAYKQLVKLSMHLLTPEEAVEALEAAATSFPAPDYPRWGDTESNLIITAARKPQPEFVPIIRRLFGSYSSLHAQRAAINLLGRIDNEESMATAIDLIIEVEGRAAMDLGEKNDDQRDMIMDFEQDMYTLTRGYLRNHALSSSAMTRLTPVIISAAQRYAALVGPAQRADGTEWLYEYNYSRLRKNMTLLIDMLGYIPGDEAMKELQTARAYSDPYLNVLAIGSLLRHTIVARPAEYELAARDAQTRWVLYTVLAGLKRLDLFPGKYLTQKLLAESDLVHRLAGDNEPGYRQDSIELMAIRTRRTSRGFEDYYFFRYPTHGFASPSQVGAPPPPPHSPWDAGVAGPFLRSRIPTVMPLDSIDNVYDQWTDSFPDEYMKRDPKKSE